MTENNPVLCSERVVQHCYELVNMLCGDHPEVVRGYILSNLHCQTKALREQAVSFDADRLIAVGLFLKHYREIIRDNSPDRVSRIDRERGLAFFSALSAGGNARKESNAGAANRRPRVNRWSGPGGN